MPRPRTLQFSAEAANGRAEIRIDGDISAWTNSAASFRAALQALINSGIRDAHVYLNTRGGNVFEANEIVNEIKRFTGRVTGEGGARVMSAGTNIAAHLEDFGMASNGMYMWHKPSGWMEGNEDQLAANLDGLKKVTDQYRKLYAKMTGLSEADIEKRWSKGDVWLTAQEAKDQGFIKRITDEAPVTQQDVQDMAASGAPKDKLPKAAQAPNTDDEMDIKALRVQLGMPETATEQEVLAKLKQVMDANAQYEAAAATQRTADVKGLIDAAIKDRKITEAHRASYEKKFAADFNATKTELEGLEPVAVIGKDPTAAPGKTSVTMKGREKWDYKEWAIKDLKGLQAMMEQDPDTFSALYEAHYGKKPELPAKA